MEIKKLSTWKATPWGTTLIGPTLGYEFEIDNIVQFLLGGTVLTLDFATTSCTREQDVG